MNPVRRASGMPSEGESADQLNLARGAGGGQDLASVIGEITLRILEDGIPVTSKGKRTLCIAWNAKIRMVKEVISFHAHSKLPFVTDCKILVQRRVKLREPRPSQNISPGIAKLSRRRNGKSTWIEPAGHRTHFGPIRTDAHIRVANQVWAFRNEVQGPGSACGSTVQTDHGRLAPADEGHGAHSSRNSVRRVD